MNGNDDPTESSASSTRRDLLELAIAAGAVAGVGGAGIVAARDEHEDEENDEYEDEEERNGPRISPVFGFSALRPPEEREPPREPDHEVYLRREGREIEGETLPEFSFQPTGLAVEEGDTVLFRFDSGGHTITAYHRRRGRHHRMPEGATLVTSPPLGWDHYWLYTFEREGVYDMYSQFYELFGMVFRIVVGDPDPEEYPPVETQGLAPLPIASVMLNRDALSPENVMEQGEVTWEEVRPTQQEIEQVFRGMAPENIMHDVQRWLAQAEGNPNRC